LPASEASGCLERAAIEKLRYEIVWSNQWEPSTKKQEASEIYVKRFGSQNHCSEDITKVSEEVIPRHDLLVGGFPCQDYSVARTLNQASGIAGKKGVLWWEIHRILSHKRPEYLFLENVDRLLKSPAKQRGRDFALMLASLSDLGYAVEWRVINAADYGMPQRRRRVFFLGYHKRSKIFPHIFQSSTPADWLLEQGVIACAMPVKSAAVPPLISLPIEGDLATITEEFNNGAARGVSPFHNTGLIVDRNVWTFSTVPNYQGPRQTLGDIILSNGDVPAEYYLNEDSLPKWEYLKGAKDETRYNKAQDFHYKYNEGAMVFPDPLDKPSRTIVTGEGGSSPSRFKHVIRTQDERLRRLMPIELERLNMFPDNHTAGVSDVRRAFFMGNALVVGIVERIGKELLVRLSD
jgi:DNA (cytosine-5)-methyltransferase 1